MSMQHAHTRTTHEPSTHVAHVDVHVAPLVQQSRRRDGALEFVAMLTVVCLITAASLAWVRGAPVAPPKPAASAAAPASAH